MALDPRRTVKVCVKYTVHLDVDVFGKLVDRAGGLHDLETASQKVRRHLRLNGTRAIESAEEAVERDRRFYA